MRNSMIILAVLAIAVVGAGQAGAVAAGVGVDCQGTAGVGVAAGTSGIPSVTVTLPDCTVSGLPGP